MTDPSPERGSAPAAVPIVMPFPTPGPTITIAYRELRLATPGSAAEAILGDAALLPRPWEPASCREPGLRFEVWQWLDEVAEWLNRDYTWDTSALIPSCWPEHPHLAHDLAVVADQRYRAAQAPTSDLLEEWHRNCLPAFVARLRERVRATCEAGHVGWPGRARHRDHQSSDGRRARERRFIDDVSSSSEA